MTETPANDTPPPGFGLASILAAAALALGLLYLLDATTGRDLDEVALGAETVSVYGEIDGDRIHCEGVAGAGACLGPAAARALPRTVIWLGNSQLHAINQFAPGERTAAAALAGEMRAEGVELLGFSLPNAALVEHYLVYRWLAGRRRIDVLVLPLVFDDTRELTIRPEVAAALGDPAVAADVAAGPLAADIAALSPDAPDPDAPPATLQDASEALLTGALEACCRLQSMRAAARGEVSLALYLARNTAFGIDAQTVRRAIPRNLGVNTRALEAMLAHAAAAGTRVLVYVAPLRTDVAPPYDAGEYAAFRHAAAAIAARHGAVFADFGELVPGRLFGTKAATVAGGAPEFDFMHFRAEGHALLADAVRRRIEGLLR